MVNVIIPTYKARDTLPQALDSLVTQTKKFFITTIVQDCDGEDYTDIVEEYRKRGLQLHLIQTPENGGPGNARQFGMDHDHMCDYFMFLDADDMYFPRAIEILYREAKLKDADIICSNFIAERAHEPGLYMDASNIPVTWTHGKIYKADFLRKNNIRFLPNLRLNEDSYFNLVAVNSTKKRFNVPETTYLWRDNMNSLTRQKEVAFFNRGWMQYVYSQVQGLKDIVRINGEISPPLVAATLNNIYMHIMEAIYMNYSTDEAKQLCLTLNTEPIIMKIIEGADFWKTLHQILKATILKDNNLIFCKMRFCDWLNEFVLDKEQF